MGDDTSGPEPLATDVLGERWAAAAKGGLPASDELQLELARARARRALFAEPRPLVRLGRYLVLERIGEGGMGVVYAAYDPELDRRIALKLLRADKAVGGRQRLLREAQALAKLMHPNVVAVHDVGTIDDDVSLATGRGAEPPGTAETGGAASFDAPDGCHVPTVSLEPASTTVRRSSVFLAMEFVDGPTFGRWLRAAPRSWREVLAIAIQAGRGLAAAHAAGLVHRDFKPDNVMIGRDGRARVMDFGLARADRGPGTIDEEDEREPDGLRPHEPTLDVTLTSPGMVLGTPAYMAPEQHHGQPTDARTDQFSFCVALWEALHGVRPFAGDSALAIAVSVTDGKLAPVPPGTGVPAWIRRVLQRGLAKDPHARWSDMDALLAALQADPARARRRTIGVAVVLGLAGGAYGLRVLDEAQRGRACERAAASISEVWNDDARLAVQSGLAATGVPYAVASAERVIAHLDTYATQWTSIRASSCRAADVDRTRGPELAVRADACLFERRAAMSAWVEALAGADPKAVLRAVETTESLPRIETCADEAALARSIAPPADRDLAARVDEVRRDLAHARAQAWNGRPHDGLATIDAALLAAEALPWKPIQAQARLAAAALAVEAGDPPVAATHLEQALALATAAGDDVLTLEALGHLVYVDAVHLRRWDRAEAWGRMAEALVPRVEPEPGLEASRVALQIGTLAFSRDDHVQAIAKYQEALAILERELPADHLSVANLRNNLGAVYQRVGRFDEAVASLEAALAVRERALGPDHPKVASTLANLAVLDLTRGRTDRGVPRLERAIELRERTLGPDHPELVGPLLNLGIGYAQQMRHEVAQSTLRRALAILEANGLGEGDNAAQVMLAIGRTHLEQGAAERGREVIERAIAIQERLLGPDHGVLSIGLSDLGWAEFELGRFERAEQLYRRALALRQSEEDPNEKDLSRSYSDLCELAGARGRHDEALVECRRALALTQAAMPSDPEGAGVHAALGYVHIARGEHAAAWLWMESARALLEHGLGPDDPGMIRRWRDLAEAAQARGDHDAARELAERARALAERLPDTDETLVAGIDLVLAEAQSGQGMHADARVSAERALAALRRASASAVRIAEAELVLGRVRLAAGDRTASADIERACTVAGAAAVLRLRECPRG